MSTGSKLYHQLCKCRKCIMIVALLMMFIMLPVIAWPYIATIRPSLTNQPIGIGQTISLQPAWYSFWCEGLKVVEYINGFSDNEDGLNVSAYLVDSSAVEKENMTVKSDRYPGVNRSIPYDKQRYLVPLNYYAEPLYLLKGSTIVLQAVIYLPVEAANTVYSAIVHVFDSEEVARKYQKGSSAKKQVHYLNVTKCVHKVCTESFIIDENSFYFFVLSSSSSATFKITTNFTFHVIRFVPPFAHPGALNIANISRNSSAFIPFHSNKQILLYAHKPDSIITGPLSHLNVTCVERQWLRSMAIFSSFVPLLLYFLIAGIFVSVKLRKLRQQNGLNVRTPLLS